MRHGRGPSLPPNRRLRRTIAGLLVSIPTLSFMACGIEGDGGCIPYGPEAATRTTTE